MGSFMKINKNIEILNQECQLLSNTQYTACHLCNRNCNINRSVSKKGYCGVSSTLKLARAALHMWEEPCITGVNGSGTVFFLVVLCDVYFVKTILSLMLVREKRLQAIA